jgi:hypothetical protein
MLPGAVFLLIGAGAARTGGMVKLLMSDVLLLLTYGSFVLSYSLECNRRKEKCYVCHAVAAEVEVDYVYAPMKLLPRA